MKKIALLTAAGSGTRMKQAVPKQFLHVNDIPVIIHTMKAFQKHPSIDEIIVVTIDSWKEVLWSYAQQYGITKLKYVVKGGASGQESIKNGILELQKHHNDAVVLVHDGNRPLISSEMISDNLATFEEHGSAVAVVPATEVVFQSQDGISSETTIFRDELFRTQTPHTYTLKKLLWAHEEAEKKQLKNLAASCSLMQQLGEKTFFSKGSEENFKLTTIEDLNLFKAMLKKQ